MRIAIGADHAGLAVKAAVGRALEAAGFLVEDLGTHSDEPVDYPDIAAAVGRAVASGRVDRGVVACGSGVGASVAANKIRGVRAGLCHDTYSAHQGVEHDDMNILVLGGRVIGEALAVELALTFAKARFSGEERHQRRLTKLQILDDERA
jgi:RpiB/LacA/LacB family sugar-phosphate isomerase